MYTSDGLTTMEQDFRTGWSWASLCQAHGKFSRDNISWTEFGRYLMFNILWGNLIIGPSGVCAIILSLSLSLSVLSALSRLAL